MHRLPTFIALLICAPCPLSAQEAAIADDSEQMLLEEIVVEATRAGITVLDVPVNTSILDTQDIQEFSTKSVDEILRQVPGFNLLRAADSISTAPTTSTVSMRGLGGSAASRTLVLLDGVPIHSPVSSEVYWARVPKHRIERIEVIRGGGANAWGNLALGGVINIVTEQPRADGLDFAGIVSYPWTLDASIAGSQLTDRWELSGQASYFDTVGYFNLPADERGEVDERAYKDYANASGKAQYRVNDAVRVYLQGSLFEEERHAGSPLDVDNTEIMTLGTGILVDTAGGSQWRASLFHEEMDVEDYSVLTSADHNEERIRGFRIQPTSMTGAGLTWSLAFTGGHHVTAGADYRWSDITVNDFSNFVNDTPGQKKVTGAEQDMGGIFIQDSWDINSRWQINASIRYDYVTNSGEASIIDLNSSQVTSFENYDRNSEHTVNPSLGAVYRMSEGISFRAAAYKGFRAATLRELYRAASTRGGVVLVNNPYLAPERLVGYEAGIDLTFFSNAFLRLTLFRNTVEDLIQNITRGVAGPQPEVIEPCGLIQANETCRELDNVGEMESTGLEMEAAYQPSETWGFFLSYLYNDTEVTQAPDNPQVVGKQVRQAPEHSFTARIRNRNRWFDTSLAARYVGERFEDEINTLRVDDFLLFDLRFTRQLSDTTSIFLNIENLLDEEYQVRVENSGATEIGRPRFIGVGLSYRR